MTTLRILLVDDEPDIRDVVELSLGLDPVFSVRSCNSGANALATAADWLPDMILCDVMMPDMDGPATLARLRDCPQTASTPVVFMTARAQARELEHFVSLGVTGRHRQAVRSDEFGKFGALSFALGGAREDAWRLCQTLAG